MPYKLYVVGGMVEGGSVREDIPQEAERRRTRSRGINTAHRPVAGAHRHARCTVGARVGALPVGVVCSR